MALNSNHPLSPFSKWVHQNEPLPPDDAAKLDAFLEDRHAELASLDQEISDLQVALELRRPQQAKLRESVDSHKKLLSAGRRLPTEILQQIFLYARTTHRLPVIRHQEVPLLLTRVCRDWRDVALGMPLLWNRIHIPIPNHFTEESVQHYLKCAERWLDAAKDTPLSISIWSYCGTGTFGEGYLESFLHRIILDRAPRIRHLILELDIELLNFITGTLPPEAWTSLDKVTLKHANELWDPDSERPHLKSIEELPIWKAPTLRRVEWVSVEGDIIALSVNWAKLQEIRVGAEPEGGRGNEEWDELSASQAHALIRDSPNLQVLQVCINDDGSEFFLEQQLNTAPISLDSPFVLKHLTTLELSDTYLDPLIAPVVFLHGLQLPALESLAYKLVCSTQGVVTESGLAPLPHGDAHPLVALLKSQKHPIRIKSFKIPATGSISQDDFFSCLKMMPLLEQLWVEDRRRVYESNYKIDTGIDIAPGVALLRHLQPPGQDPAQVVCPKLTSLRLDRTEDLTFDDLEAFVRDRLALADVFSQALHPRECTFLYQHKAASEYSTVATLGSITSNILKSDSTAVPNRVARLTRLHIGMTTMKTDHVPRDYSPRRGRPSCALEEDLWELGVDAHLHLREADFCRFFRRTQEVYDARGGHGYWYSPSYGNGSLPSNVVPSSHGNQSFVCSTMREGILADSPFKSLLKGNYTLSDADATRLRHLLEQPVAQLEALDREVEELECTLEDLLTQRLLLRATFEKHKALLHPIRSLPKSILEQIFVFCLPPHPHLPTLHRKAAPLTLTRVCRRWRAIALDTPRLWQGLHIVVQKGTRPFVEFHMKMVDRWLSAAKDLPLTISVWFRPEADQVPTEDLFDIFKDKILSHSSTIRELRLEVPPSLVGLFGDSVPSSSWPLLEKVVLKGPKELHIQSPLRVPNLAIWKAPRLKQVEWVSLDSNILSAELPWDQLEDIQVYQNFEQQGHSPRVDFYPPEARALLQSTTNLRNLRLTLSEYPRLPDNEPPIPELKTLLVLPHLTSLSLTDVYLKPELNPVVFLEGLELPSLTFLRYELRTTSIGYQHPEQPLAPPPPLAQDHPLVKFLGAQKSPIMLRAFEVNVSSLSPHGLVACLTMMPLLERLIIRDRVWSARDQQLQPFSKGLLDLLSPSSERTMDKKSVRCLCPRLTGLRISHIVCDLQDVEAFVDARLAYAKEQSTVLSTHVPSLNDISMRITAHSRVEGCPKERKEELVTALWAKGVKASFEFSDPRVPRVELLDGKRFDPFGGYERERRYELLDEGWM